MLVNNVLCLSFVLACNAEIPDEPGAVLSWIGQHWDQKGWQLPGSQNYMRKGLGQGIGRSARRYRSHRLSRSEKGCDIW